MADVYLVHFSGALHRAGYPRTPTDRERAARGEPKTACGRQTNKTGVWKEVRLNSAAARTRPVCFTCFPDGLPMSARRLRPEGSGA